MTVMGSSTVTPAADLSDLTAAVLVGGFGTRLRPVVADRPKVLAEIHGRPFLAYLFDQLIIAGCRSVVLCTGYLGEQVARTFGEQYGSLRLRYSQEPEPLGTGGALRFALAQFASDPVLVLNGDSFYTTDLKAFRDWHWHHRATASIALTRVRRSDRFGHVKLDADAQIVSFSEKHHDAGPGWINAGIYLLGREVLENIPEGKNISLEHDVFPCWTGRGLYGYYSPGRFLDIGTPEDFAKAEGFLGSAENHEEKGFVVLDRDGTIIEECEYLSDPEQVRLIPRAAAALSQLQAMGYGLVVITNQSGIGRGFFDETAVQRIHQRLQQLLGKAGVSLDGLYVCPHKPDDDCLCRKPKLGLMQLAARDLGFSPAHSIVIGDKPCDIELGRNAGAVTFLVRTGYGAQVEAEQSVTADYVVDDLQAVVRAIRHWAALEGSVYHDHQ
jgi:histidinol-phosphate phosphatase family protein